MSSWMNEAAAIPNHPGNGFHHMGDPNNMAGAGMMDPSAFMANAGQFNPSAAGQQFPNPQQMAVAMQNGQMRNASPSFSNPVYQTNSVVPSKRPRPREDSIGASPRQNPGMLPTSRAGTPQQSQFPGFQPNAMQPQNPGQPQHYPHLQPNGSSTASPSPVMAGNQLRPGSVPQRVNTASPHPFSPASQQFGQQASPVPSEHGNTPQPGMYMNPQGFPQGYNPGFAPSPSPGRPPSAQNAMAPQMAPHQMGQMGQQMPQMHPNQMFPNQQMHPMQQMQMQQMQAQAMQGRGGMDPKMMYHMRLQQQYGQGNMPPGAAAEMQAQNMAQNRGMMPKQGMPMQNGQMPPGMRPQQPPQMTRGITPELFMKNLSNFMATRQLPLDMSPVVEGRPLHLFQLFQVVQKYSGYHNVTARNMWPQIAASIGFIPQQVPSAPGHIKGVYERNLVKFEEAWASQQRSHHMKQQSTGAVGMPATQGQGTPQRMPQLSPSQNMQPTQPQMPPQNTQSPAKPMGPGMPQSNVNGFFPPQHPQTPQQQPNSGPGPLRNSMPRSVDATPVTAEFPIQSPGPAGKPGAVPLHHPNHQTEIVKVNGGGTIPFPGLSSANKDVYSPLSRALASQESGGSWGGLEVDIFNRLCGELIQVKPDMPPLLELGNIDLHALTKSIQSGIHGEVRLALDILATVSRQCETAPPLIIELRACEDLVESLLDCAEEQIDLLTENAEPISDEIDLTSYEDILRAARAEQFYLRKVHVFGDRNYELERAADRLIAITTILRNFSFHEQNQPVLADEVVIKFFCSLIRSLGTHEGLLRTAQNTLDIMKDIIVLLSNIAADVELPGRDQAFCLLQFILAFAPSPMPSMTADKLVFSPFEPSVHKYLPYALDALAKLLARDEPNRTHYKTIVATDALSSNPYELLTRTFALVISPIPYPSYDMRPGILPPSVEARKPLLMQGLLAADIIAQLAPSYESGLTRAWLSSGDGFAQKLLTLVRTICQHSEHPVARPGTNTRHREDPDLLYIVTCAVSALRRLSEKARDPNDAASIPPNALPTRASLFDSLNNLKNPKWASLLNQLSAYVGLEN
ncbi:hypothetical protein GQX73_g5746 [Xylaria multiplex]|uniref:ARID domain-containing protein n=1 Tax=Xylaria multiplex TaxID=323545 RepID=A0A7C8IQN5_9PEZI|nr:hypothetical protein GQX73_g5746 [Xylaria multiplex]